MVKQSKTWFLTAAAAEVLDLTPRQLSDLRRNGMFKLGRDYRDISPPGAARPTYQYHVKRCEQALLTPPEKR